MLITRRSLIATAGATAALLGLGAVSARAAEFPEMTLRLAHAAARSHPHNIAAEQFAKNIADRTGGKVKVEVYPAGELGDQPTLAEQLSLSSIDFSIISLGNLATYVPKLSAMTAPFLFTDYDHAHRVIDGYVMDWMNKDLGSMDAVALSMVDYGFRHTTTNNIVVKTADDLKGVKIRVPPSPGLLAAFDALGANTQSIAYSELYSALKQGVVDGEENPVFTVQADSLFETQNQLSLTGHYFDCQAFLVNKTTWDGLPPDLQAIISEEAISAQNLTRKLIQGGEAEVIEKLKTEGMTVTVPDKESFIAKMEPAYDKIGQMAGKAEMTALLAAVKQYK